MSNFLNKSFFERPIDIAMRIPDKTFPPVPYQIVSLHIQISFNCQCRYGLISLVCNFCRIIIHLALKLSLKLVISLKFSWALDNKQLQLPGASRLSHMLLSHVIYNNNITSNKSLIEIRPTVNRTPLFRALATFYAAYELNDGAKWIHLCSQVYCL